MMALSSGFILVIVEWHHHIYHVFTDYIIGNHGNTPLPGPEIVGNLFT